MNFQVGDQESQQLPREFLAVVLAGFGNELNPLTANHGEGYSPKSLLPIANSPLLGYVLSWIEESEITDVLLICPSIHRAAIAHFIASSPLRIDLHPTDESPDTSVGTCALLRQFSSRIKEDFVLLPCDLIPGTLQLSTILDKFRTDVVSRGTLATTCWHESEQPQKAQYPADWASSSTATPIIWDKSSDTLLYVDPYDDFDRDKGFIELRMSLLTHHPRVSLSSRYTDSHVYICQRSVLDLLNEKAHFDSVREDFFPWLCKLQYQKSKLDKYGRVLLNSHIFGVQPLALQHSTLDSCHPEDHADGDDQSQSSMDGTPAPLQISIFLHKGPLYRVNTLANFFGASKSIPKEPYILPSDPKERSLIDQKAQISPDSLVGPSTTISERAVLKRATIGSHCVIGKMTKIVDCIIFDHCVIQDGARMEGCILGNNTTVGAKAELVRCVTQPGYEVAAEESCTDEKLEISDWGAPEPTDSEDVDDDDDDDDEEDDDDDDEEEEDDDDDEQGRKKAK